MKSLSARTVESFDSYTRAKDQHQDRDGPDSVSNGVLCARRVSVLGGCADVLESETAPRRRMCGAGLRCALSPVFLWVLSLSELVHLVLRTFALLLKYLLIYFVKMKF